MNIKDRKSISFKSLIFGAGPEDTDTNANLRVFVMGATIILWGIFFILSIGMFYISEKAVLVEIIIDGLLIASSLGTVATLISIMGKSDFNKQYGMGMFIRALSYNVVLFLTLVLIDTNISVKEYKEPVKEFQFLTTDIDKCNYLIRMKSDNLTYDYCSDYDSEYKELEKAEVINAVLVGKVKFGINNAAHVEFIKKKVTNSVK